MNVGAYSFKIENKKYEPFPYVFYSMKQYMSQQFSLFLLVTFTHVATGSLSLCLANGKYDYLHERCGEMSIFFFAGKEMSKCCVPKFSFARIRLDLRGLA